MQTSKTAVQVILLVSLLVWYLSPDPMRPCDNNSPVLGDFMDSQASSDSLVKELVFLDIRLAVQGNPFQGIGDFLH